MNWNIVRINVIIPIIACACLKCNHAGARTECTPNEKPHIAKATPNIWQRKKRTISMQIFEAIRFTCNDMCNGLWTERCLACRPTRYPIGKIIP